MNSTKNTFKPYNATLSSSILWKNNKNDVRFEYVYIKIKRLIFTFPLLATLDAFLGFGSQRAFFTNLEAAPLSSLPAFFLSVISLTLFMYTLILSNSCFTGCSLGLTPELPNKPKTLNLMCKQKLNPLWLVRVGPTSVTTHF